MSNSREIRSKINGVKNTQKITGAMELVAASKMRAARNKMEEVRPYAEYAKTIVKHATKANIEYPHPYLDKREIKNACIIVVSTDRGLCGGLNINLFKSALTKIKEYQENNINVNLCLFGSKAELFFKRLSNVNIVASTDFGGKRNIKIKDVMGGINIVLNDYDAKKIDEVILFNNSFINTIRQKPKKQCLLPIYISNDDTNNINSDSTKNNDSMWDYLYEPDAHYVLDIFLKRYIESQIYCGVIENLACEQAARMMAMKNATDNAGEIIDELKLKYNKARQASITQELAEIVSGAAAV